MCCRGFPPLALHHVSVQFLCDVYIIPESQWDAHLEGNPPRLQRPPVAQAASHGQCGDSGEWALVAGGGGCMFVGREKGVGNFVLSSFKRALLLLGLPLPCRTHKHIYNVFPHALCVDQYRKIFKNLDSKVEHVISSHQSPCPHHSH